MNGMTRSRFRNPKMIIRPDREMQGNKKADRGLHSAVFASEYGNLLTESAFQIIAS